VSKVYINGLKLIFLYYYVLKKVLYNYLLCLAGIKENLIQKHPSFKTKIEELSKKDPSGRNKYLPYMVKILVSGQALENEIIDVIKLFNKYQHKLTQKDIYQYHNFTELRDLLFEIDRDKNKSKRQEKLEIKTEGGRKIYEDDQCVVIYVKDKAASCFYGSGTKWCITMNNYDYFEDYQSENIIFYFVLRKDLDKEDSNYKVAVVVYRNDKNKIIRKEYFDALDVQSSTPEYLNDLTKLSSILAIIDLDAAKVEKTFLSRLVKDEASEKEIIDNWNKLSDGVQGRIAGLSKNSAALNYIIENSAYYDDILYAIMGNENLTISNFEKLYEKFPDKNKLFHTVIAHDKSKELLQYILDNKIEEKYIIQHMVYIFLDSGINIDKLFQFKKILPIIAIYASDKEVIKKLLNTNDKHVLEALSRNNASDPETLSSIYNENKNSKIIDLLARRDDAPPDILLDIFNHHNNPQITKLLARNSSTPPNILLEISKLREENTNSLNYIFYNLAENKNTPEEALWNIADAQGVGYYILRANHNNISERIIRKIYNSEGSLRIKEYISRNLKYLPVPQDIISDLLKEDVFRERIVSTNFPLTKENYDYLINLNSMPTIRQLLVHNKYIPSEILNKLVNKYKNLDSLIASHNNITDEIAEKLFKDKENLYFLSKNQNVSPQILEKIYNKIDIKDNNILYYLAKNPRTPLTILNQITSDVINDKIIDLTVATALGENSSTSLEILKKLHIKYPTDYWINQAIREKETSSTKNSSIKIRNRKIAITKLTISNFRA